MNIISAVVAVFRTENLLSGQLFGVKCFAKALLGQLI